MKVIYTTAMILFALMQSGCMYSSIIHFDGIAVDDTGRTQYANITTADKGKIRDLTNAIMGLSPDVDREEAYFIAHESVLYPKILANTYNLMTPPNYQNHLINTGQRKRGLCYQWAEDLMAHMQRPFKTIILERGMAYQWKPLEHNIPTVRAMGQPFSSGIILDAWRESSNLVWMKIKDDRAYPWIPFVEPSLTRPKNR